MMRESESVCGRLTEAGVGPMQAAAPIIPAGNPVRLALLERQGGLTQLHGGSSAYTLLGHALRWLGAAERGGALGNSSVRACEEVLLSMAFDYEGFATIPIHSSPRGFWHAMAYVSMAVGSSPPAAGESWWRQAADV